MSEFNEFEDQNDMLGAGLNKPRAGAPGADVYVGSEADFETVVTTETPSGIRADAHRYIFFAGDVMEDGFKRSRPEFHLGGEFYGQDYPALAISKFFLARCRITPLTIQPRPIGTDELRTNSEVHRFDGAVKIGAGETIDRARLSHVKAFPAHQVDAIVHGNRDGQYKGVIELSALREMDYNLPSVRKFVTGELQDKFFPGWIEILRGEKFLPETLKGIEQMIMEARDKYASDEIVRLTAKEMLGSCAQFRLYGVKYLTKEATRIRAGVNQSGGYVHTYSEVAEALLRQLDMKRESLVELAQPPAQVVAAPASDPALAEAMLANASAMNRLVEQNQTLLNLRLAEGAPAVGARFPRPETAKPEETADEAGKTANDTVAAGGKNESESSEKSTEKTSETVAATANVGAPANAGTVQPRGGKKFAPRVKPPEIQQS